jgi:hypothetical protein
VKRLPVGVHVFVYVLEHVDGHTHKLDVGAVVARFKHFVVRGVAGKQEVGPDEVAARKGLHQAVVHLRTVYYLEDAQNNQGGHVALSERQAGNCKHHQSLEDVEGVTALHRKARKPKVHKRFEPFREPSGGRCRTSELATYFF